MTNHNLQDVIKRNIWIWPKYSYDKFGFWSKLFRDRYMEAKIELERLHAEEQKELERERSRKVLEKFRNRAILRDFLPSRFLRK